MVTHVHDLAPLAAAIIHGHLLADRNTANLRTLCTGAAPHVDGLSTIRYHSSNHHFPGTSILFFSIQNTIYIITVRKNIPEPDPVPPAIDALAGKLAGAHVLAAGAGVNGPVTIVPLCGVAVAGILRNPDNLRSFDCGVDTDMAGVSDTVMPILLRFLAVVFLYK